MVFAHHVAGIVGMRVLQQVWELARPEAYEDEDSDTREARAYSDTLREAQLLALCHHDCIVAFRGVVIADTPHSSAQASGNLNSLLGDNTKPLACYKYILTELAQHSLHGYLNFLRSENKLFPIPLVVKLARDVLSALEYMRQFHIIHRDLKPGNVLVFINDDGYVHFKVADLGQSKVMKIEPASECADDGRSLGDDETLLSAPMTEGVGATPAYAAPEVLQGDNRCGVECD